MRFDAFSVLEWSAQDRRSTAIYCRTEDDMVTDSEWPGVCVGATALGAQQPRDVAGAVGGVPWEAHVDCRASDQVMRLEIRRLKGVQGKWPDSLVLVDRRILPQA
jgi:hypothetical protein